MDHSVRRKVCLGQSAGTWLAVLLFVGGTVLAATAVVEVKPTVETRPAAPVGDADDICIWVHPTKPAESVVIGTDKEHGLDVYDLSGRQIQHVEHGHMNNVDLRYNFPLGGRKVDLVAASNKDTTAANEAERQSIALYAMDPVSRKLVYVGARPLTLAMDAYGLCLYHDLRNDKFYAIVNSYAGGVEQWELFDNGQGKVDGKRVRTFQVGSRTEGMVCDDERGILYIGEENVGIWKYPATPDVVWQPCLRILVDLLGPRGYLSDDFNHDIEGLALYSCSDGTGYLIASCQGRGTFSVYRREGTNPFLGTFHIGANDAKQIDAVGNTDGCEVCNASLGAAFPKGVFVAHDGSNKDGDPTNFKMVPWEAIATALRLKVDTTWDPRRARPRD